MNFIHLTCYTILFEKQKMHVNTTSAFNVNYKIAVTCIYCSGESCKWTFMPEHVFKVPTPSMHILWSQMVTPASMMFLSKSKQVCIKRFRRSSMSWMFVSYTLCCITPHMSKCKAHDDPGPHWWSYDIRDAIFFGNITFWVFWLSQGSVTTLIRWGGWSS